MCKGVVVTYYRPDRAYRDFYFVVTCDHTLRCCNYYGEQSSLLINGSFEGFSEQSIIITSSGWARMQTILWVVISGKKYKVIYNYEHVQLALRSDFLPFL